MINENNNRLYKNYSSIVISPKNKSYGLDDNLKNFSGFKKSIACPGTDTNIFIYNSDILRRYLDFNY